MLIFAKRNTLNNLSYHLNNLRKQKEKYTQSKQKEGNNKEHKSIKLKMKKQQKTSN